MGVKVGGGGQPRRWRWGWTPKRCIQLEMDGSIGRGGSVVPALAGRGAELRCTEPEPELLFRSG